MGSIGENLETVRKNILRASEKSGRSAESVRLIAVSKTHPVSDIREAYEARQFLFGENKVQELSRKAAELQDIDISWHMIGHLQINKVKYLTKIAPLIHSLDSLKLASEIEKQAAKAGLVMDALIEVNISGEESKFGLSPSEVPDFVREISLLKHIHIKGLMTIAPECAEAEMNRPYFKSLRELLYRINRMDIPEVKLTELSMGMSGDYTVAIEEGATFVRVGTAIFGERDYTL